MELSQGVDVNYVMPCMLPGHVSQGPFHSYGVRRHLVNRAINDVFHKNKEKLFSICLANNPRKSGTWPDRFKQLLTLWPKGWTCPCGCSRGINKSNWTVHQWHFQENQKPLSLFSSNCVPPFRGCFRFLLKFSALKKFTSTGACYGLLTTNNPVCCMCNNWKLLAKITEIKALQCFKVFREGVFFNYRNSQFSERHTTNFPETPVLITNFEKRRQKWTFKTFYETV